MPEPLVTCLQRYLDDAKTFERRVAGRCVLVYEPPEADEDEDTEAHFRFRTVSGQRDAVMGGGEPVVVFLEKTKDNAMRHRITLGRTANNDIVLDDASVSRFHAWFEKTAAGGWTLADAGSKNGTELEGAPLAPKRPATLENGNRVKIGQIDLTFLTAAGFLKFLRSKGT